MAGVEPNRSSWDTGCIAHPVGQVAEGGLLDPDLALAWCNGVAAVARRADADPGHQTEMERPNRLRRKRTRRLSPRLLFFWMVCSRPSPPPTSGVDRGPPPETQDWVKVGLRPCSPHPAHQRSGTDRTEIPACSVALTEMSLPAGSSERGMTQCTRRQPDTDVVLFQRPMDQKSRKLLILLTLIVLARPVLCGWR